MSPNYKRRTARLLGAVSAVALAFGLLPVSPASADHPTPPEALDFAEACANAPLDVFTDDDGSLHEDAIDCVAFYEITSGKTPTTFAPAESVRRDQMATFIAQLIDYAAENGTGAALPAAPATNPFACPSNPDLALVPTNLHYDNILRLAEAGIVAGGVEGNPSDCYGPSLNVRRDQMATFIVSAVEFSTGTDIASTTDYFADDDDSVHESNINAGASASLIAGRGTNDEGHNIYEPASPIRRDQMAAFLARSVQYLVDQGIIAPKGTQAGQVALNSRSVEQGGAITGTITGDDIQSVTVSGCGLNNQTIGADENTEQAGRQFTLNVPVDQPAGNCTLTFTITRTDGTTATETEAITVTERVGQATVTTRPELVSSSIVQTTSQGTTVRYIFDEALTGTSITGNAPLFHVLTFGSNGVAGRFDAATAVVDAANTRSVLATFPSLTTTADAASLSVATVDFDAVRGLEGTAADGNAIGDAPLNQGSTAQLQARRTAGPDLLTVSNLRANPAVATETLVDFTFDEGAFNNLATGYNLVLTDGTTELDCTVVSGDGTATHTVACPNNPAGSTTAILAANVARGYVETGTVDDVSGAGGNPNPLQAADVSGTSETPDLVSAEIRRDVDLGGGVIRDQILYTFDEPVLVGAGGPTAYRAYLSSGAELLGQAAPVPSRSTTNDTQVLVTFGTTQDALDLAVGASVDDGAVIEGTGTQNRPNQEDEVGVSNVGTGPTTTSGRTAAPDLTAVSIERITDAFGATVGARVRYTFDEDVVVLVPGNFFIVLSDGTRYACNQTVPAAPAAGTTEETDNQVTCTSFGTATTTQILSAVLGTVDDGAVANQAANTGPGTTTAATAGTDRNPEGLEVATGTTGTPQQ